MQAHATFRYPAYLVAALHRGLLESSLDEARRGDSETQVFGVEPTVLKAEVTPRLQQRRGWHLQS